MEMRLALIGAVIAALGLIWASLTYAQPPDALASKVETKAPASSQPADTPKPPDDLAGAVEKGKEAVAAAQAGQWWYFSSVVCLVIMFVLKAAKLLEKMDRWKYIVLPILSLAAALLAAFQGGVGWSQAIGVFGTSWAMGMLEELINHGILGKPHSTTG
jgi:hypothetical protein